MDLEFLKFGLIAAELWLLAGAFLILLAGMFAPTKQNFPNILSIVFHLIAILWLLVYFPTTGEGFYGFIFADSWSQSLKILLIVGSLFCVLRIKGSDFLKFQKQDPFKIAELSYFIVPSIENILFRSNAASTKEVMDAVSKHR